MAAYSCKKKRISLSVKCKQRPMFTQYNSNKTLFLLKYKVKHFIKMKDIKNVYVPYTKLTDQGIINYNTKFTKTVCLLDLYFK